MGKSIDSNSPVSKSGIGSLKLNVRKHTADINSVVESEPSIGTPSTVASSDKSGINQATTLLKSLWRSDNLVHQISYQNRQPKQFKNEPVIDVNDAVSNAFSNSDAGLDSYFALAEYTTAESRTAANVSGANGFWMDIDVGEAKAAAGKGYSTIEDAEAALVKFCKDNKIPLPTHFVNSGGGLHLYWATREFIGRDSWQKFAKMLKAVTKLARFLADDTRTADIASVLRVPGTYNYKYNPPRLVVLMHSTKNYIDNDLMLTTIEAAYNRLCVTENVADKTNSTTHENVGTGHTNAGTTASNMPETPVNIENVESALAAIDPDCGREEWFKTCCAIRSLDWIYGESLARAWSKGDFWNSSNKTDSKYDAQEFDIMWRSIKSDAGISIGTLFHYAKEAGWALTGLSQFDEFVLCETIIIEANSKIVKQADVASDSQTEKSIAEPAPKMDASDSQSKAHSLAKYSLSGMSAELEKYASEEVTILGQIALKGQATVIYAAPNTGKTLLTISLLIEAIKQKRIADPSKVFYVNVDDTSNGLLDKLAYAEEYGFHMFAEGYNGFKAKNFLGELQQLTENNQVNGAILIFDTVKKFVNLMDKTKSSEFTAITRMFTGKGGTIIALAHTNKNLNASGKPVSAGTSDVGDDFDCKYTLAQVGGINLAGDKTVCFDNNKSRGNVAQSAAYSYSNESAISYTERLMSVEAIDQTQLNTIRRDEEVKSDAEVIGVVIACITEGINTKTKLAFAVAERTATGRGTVIKLIDKYTGTDAAIHKWNFAPPAARGAKVFTVLATPASDSERPIAV